MGITKSDIESISEADLEELRSNEVSEGILYDYKLELYGGSDADKKEFLKDTSSFANTAGGHILIGADEDQGLPTSFPGLTEDIDREKQRLESLLRDRIEPRILGVRIQPIALANGRHVLVIRIPQSWNPPHAVLQNKSRLIYARNSAGVHEASVDEMRAMFNAGASILEQARDFQRARMEVVDTAEGPFSNLPGAGRFVLHIIPISAFNSQISANLTKLDPHDLTPIWCSGCNFGYNVDGYWTTSGSGERCGYLQVFRNGIIETAAADVRTSSNGGPYLLAQGIEDQIAVKVEQCLSSLRRADVPLPAFVMAGGLRMHGAHIFRDPNAATLQFDTSAAAVSKI
jgi:Putative DNA-binding domain